jgi:hypothetical protein
MRRSLFLIPLLAVAAPLYAQEPAPAASLPTADIQQALNDPATADRVANAMQALSKAFLDLPAGEVQAALEGRKPTAAEKKLTVRDLGRRDDPNFDRNFQRQIAESKPMIQQSMKALNQAMPAIVQGLGQAQQALERAVANMPQPGYPKR